MRAEFIRCRFFLIALFCCAAFAQATPNPQEPQNHRGTMRVWSTVLRVVTKQLTSANFDWRTWIHLLTITGRTSNLQGKR
jgi:hypothetical protein